MSVTEIIHQRRAYRSLNPVEISDELIKDLILHASLAPSCFNNQPWRFVPVKDGERLQQMQQAMSKGNEWTKNASMIIAVCSEKSLDCLIKPREYYLFDTGLAAAFLILRATELGLVAHPIAGYDPEKVTRILDIPDAYTVITLIVVGKKSNQPSPLLSEKMNQAELTRPPRKPFPEIASIDSFTIPESSKK